MEAEKHTFLLDSEVVNLGMWMFYMVLAPIFLQVSQLVLTFETFFFVFRNRITQ